MTRAGLRMLALPGLLLLLAAGCGKYGEPIRPATATSAGAGGGAAAAPASHPDDCADPAHDHASGSGDRPLDR